MQHVIFVSLAILCAGYLLLSIGVAIYLKSENPDGAFDDISFLKLMIYWPKLIF